MAPKLVGLSFAWKVVSVVSMQQHHLDQQLKLVQLDEIEVEERGSHCIDGSAPMFYHKVGSGDKWSIDLNAACGLCASKDECFSKMPLHATGSEMSPENLHRLFDDEEYHYVYVPYCDFGMYMGNRSEPVWHNGQKMYFQGARIIKHVIDTLSASYPMREVLLAGGSGGGQAMYAGANYFKSIMPTSVTKFGLVAVNGWYPLKGDFREMFDLNNMQSTVNQGCLQKMAKGDAHKCLEPVHAYDDAEPDIFITQIFDHTFEPHVEHEVKRAYVACIERAEPAPHCNADHVGILNAYLNSFSRTIQASPKYKQKGYGGYFSTCTEHVFYRKDNFWKYENAGVTAGDAIVRWWESLEGGRDSEWYWPCELGTPSRPQCEGSCWL